MIDMHSYIQPRDDGPSTLEDSLEMARMAVKDGIHTMIATPHILNDLLSNYKKEILSACDAFMSALEKNDIPFTVLLSFEVHLTQIRAPTL